jgi:hypothetical protein
MSVGITPLHEAAHAVCAHLLDLPITSATVVRKGQNLGLVQFRDSTATFQATPDRARLLIVCSLAGRAAVSRTYVDGGLGCEGDDDQAWALARQLVGSDPAHAEEVALVVKEAWQEARELVGDWSQAITDLARDLELWGVLRGEQLTARVAEAVERDRASPTQQRQRETRQAFWRWMEEQGGHHDGNG